MSDQVGMFSLYERVHFGVYFPAVGINSQLKRVFGCCVIVFVCMSVSLVSMFCVLVSVLVFACIIAA